MIPQIRHLFLSPGHNYFGHHGQAPGDHGAIAVDAVDCIAGRGLRGDRFLDYRPDYKGQITFFRTEDLDGMWQELAVVPGDRDPAATRRNVLIEGVDLLALVGREFDLQGVRFAGVEECRPCYWMNGAIHQQAEAWLRGRGGLRARIVTDGRLTRGAAPLALHPPLAGLLLAGGRSVRMGRDKARIQVGGGALGPRQLDVLRAVAGAVAVAAPTRPSWLDDDTPHVPDVPGGGGPLAGLRAGLAWASAQDAAHLAVLALDMPGVTAPWLRALAAHRVPGTGVVAAGPRGPEPAAAIYPVDALPFADEVAARGDGRLRLVWTRLAGANRVHTVVLEPAEAERRFANLNTPADVGRWEAAGSA